MNRLISLATSGLIILALLFYSRLGLADSACPPGWEGKVLIDGESLQNWRTEAAGGSSGSLQSSAGATGQAVQLNWNIGTGDWVQAVYVFPQAVDLSGADLFGISLRGGGSTEKANTIGIMFADVNGVFFGYDMRGNDHGLNQIDRWLTNLALPKKLFNSFFSGANGATAIDWSKIARVFVVVKRPIAGAGGGAGQLRIDDFRYDTAANWPRQASFDHIDASSVPPHVSQRAVAYVLSSQTENGLFISWKQEPSPKAHLYDQALVLVMLTREAVWQQGQAANSAASAAQRLVNFVGQRQKSDGHWPRTWNPHTGEELADDAWVGDQAWWTMALSSYAARSGDGAARASAQRGADWLAARIDVTGQVVTSTEGTVDAWWAMLATERFAEADRIQGYLLNEATVWDADMRYWWRGLRDPVIAIDAATWLSSFSRHPRVNQSARGLAALSIARRTLIAQSDNGRLCGLDNMGPVSVWNEGTAQYVAAGGADGKTFLDRLIAQQNPDGSMPGSTDSWSTDNYGWLSHWNGLSATAWLYFAVNGSPFYSDIGVDIKANSSDGPVSVSPADELSVTIQLGGGDFIGRSADWWVVAATPWGDWYYYLHPNQWINAGPKLSEVKPTYQGPIARIESFEVLRATGLPKGIYNMYFGVDLNMNRLLDFDSVYYDSLQVIMP